MSIGSRPETSFSQQNATKEAEYLIEHVGPALQYGLAALQTYRPKDPIEYLARYLYKFVENEKCMKQMEADQYNLQQEILLHEEDLRLAKEREEERKRLQIEEEEMKKKKKELEEKQKKEEELARKKAEEEAKERAEQEAAEALLNESLDLTDGEKNELTPIDVEEGKLPPVVETDELEYSTREPTKVADDIEENHDELENPDGLENPDNQTINEEPDE